MADKDQIFWTIEWKRGIIMAGQSAEQQQARLAALYEVSARLGTTLDLAELLNLVMDSIIQLTGAERGILMLFNEATGKLESMAARKMDQETLDGRSLEISHNIVDRVVSEGQPLLTDNAQEDSRFIAHESVVSYQLRSIMCAPLRVRGRIIGAAYVDNRLFTNHFSQPDLDLLTAFSNQAAVAIENARLFTQTDQALARRVEELALFQRIDQELNKSLDLNRVLDLALDWAVTLTGAGGGSIGLLEADEEGQAFLRLLVHKGDDPEVLEIVPADHPILAQVLAGGHSVQTRNVTPAQAIDGTAASIQLAVPIQREGHITGLITLENHHARSYGQEDVAFVERLADRAAVAIENSRLYEAVQAADKAKSTFISIVTHELRIPMTSIKGYTDLMLAGLVGTLTEQQKEFLAIIRRNLERMNVLVRDLSDINRIESGRIQFEYATFPLYEVVEDVVQSLGEQLQARRQTVAIEAPPDLPPVYADRTRTSQVLANLLSNAHKYSPDGAHITICLGSNGEFAEVAVTDAGLGISAEDQARLFTQFFRSDDAAVREQTGWGLGLSIVKKIVQAQGGDIYCQSEYGKGSTFTFTVPLGVEG
jgi:signal transduction histidine kinase